jgi:hypothetical protein
MRQELRHGPLWRLVPDSGLNVRLCLMRARCASATNPVAPGTTSVIPPTKTQAAVPPDETLAHAELSTSRQVLRLPFVGPALAGSRPPRASRPRRCSRPEAPAASVYWQMAEHVVGEGCPWDYLRAEAIRCVVRGMERSTDPATRMVIRGCSCWACIKSSPGETTFAKIQANPQLPHSYCAKPPCKCHPQRAFDNSSETGTQITPPLSHTRSTQQSAA